MAIGKEVNLDELNIRNKEELLAQFVVPDEEKKQADNEKSLSIAERMMRRAQSKSFKLTFVDVANDDEIELEFRLLYSGERRDLLKLIEKIQKLQDENESVDLDAFNDTLDALKTLVKKVTLTEGMIDYYDSEYCQDGDIFEIAKSVMAHTVQVVEESRSFRKE